MALDITITTRECGEFRILNSTGTVQSLVVFELIGNTVDSYTYTPVDDYLDPIVVGNGESTTILVPDSAVYKIVNVLETWEGHLLNLCRIDKCIIEMIRNIMCNDGCDCNLCDDIVNIKRYIMVSTLYDILQDFFDIHFGEPVTSFTEAVLTSNELYSMYDLIQKISEICNCKTC